jgi:hypothetical protein
MERGIRLLSLPASFSRSKLTDEIYGIEPKRSKSKFLFGVQSLRYFRRPTKNCNAKKERKRESKWQGVKRDNWSQRAILFCFLTDGKSTGAFRLSFLFLQFRDAHLYSILNLRYIGSRWINSFGYLRLPVRPYTIKLRLQQIAQVGPLENMRAITLLTIFSTPDEIVTPTLS